MKYSLALVAAVAAAVHAADVQLSDLAQCGQTCVGNMAEIMVSQYGCAKDDYKCYCSNSAYGWGIRDCSNQNCGTANDGSAAPNAIAYGLYLCGQQSGS